MRETEQRADMKLDIISRYIRESFLADYLNVDPMTINSEELSEEARRNTLFDAIKDKYEGNHMVNMWLKHMEGEDTDELLDWIEYDMLLRN